MASTHSPATYAALPWQSRPVSSFSGKREGRQLMFDKFQSRLNLEGKVETLTAIRVGAGSSASPVRGRSPRCARCRELSLHSRFKFQRVCCGPILKAFSVVLQTIHSVVCNPVEKDGQCINRDKMHKFER